MNPLKTLSFSACALIGATQVATADVDASFEIWKEYRQNSSGIPDFRYGTATMWIEDGTYSLTACARNFDDDNGSFGINFSLACATGSNGLYIDTFSEQDPEYFELAGLEAATRIETGYPNLVTLYSKPLSDFPRTLTGVESESASMFYNLLTSTVREIRFGGYYWTREYFSRKQMEAEIKPEGQYVFQYPALKGITETGVPKGRLQQPYGVLRMVEGYKEDPFPGGFKFVNVNRFEDGFAEYDPRVINNFQWYGLNQNTLSNGDRTYVAFKELDGSDPNAEGGAIQFPPTGERMQLDSPIDPEYSLPPGFSVFGEAVLFEVTLERFSGVGSGGPSRRIFTLPIKFVNTFPGAMAAAFPAKTNPALMAAEADPDGDGVSNWIEWLSGTNPTKANAPKTLSALTRVNGSSTKSGDDSGTRWEMSFDRPIGLSRTVDAVTIESSTDLKTWTALPKDGEDTTASGGWKEVDEQMSPKVYARSNSEQLGEKRYFRVKFSQ